MKVELVSLTKSLITEKELTPEELIVYIARVSNPSNQLNTETSDKLIKYLIRNKHWSPLEMVDMTVDIHTSRGIAQQIIRHRSFSFQEFSQRYAEVTDFEPIELRKSGATNRQSSLEPFDPNIELSHEIISGIDKGCQYTESGTASKIIKNYLSEGERLYKELLNKGVAKECARFVLPITTSTRIFMKGSIRSWVHYLQIRCDEHTQLEHRLVAEEIKEIFKVEFPNISKALEL